VKVIRHDHESDQLTGPLAQEIRAYFEESTAAIFLFEDWDAVSNNAGYTM
jgi:hypothetical protein